MTIKEKEIVVNVLSALKNVWGTFESANKIGINAEFLLKVMEDLEKSLATVLNRLPFHSDWAKFNATQLIYLQENHDWERIRHTALGNIVVTLKKGGEIKIK